MLSSSKQYDSSLLTGHLESIETLLKLLGRTGDAGQIKVRFGHQMIKTILDNFLFPTQQNVSLSSHGDINCSIDMKRETAAPIPKYELSLNEMNSNMFIVFIYC